MTMLSFFLNLLPDFPSQKEFKYKILHFKQTMQLLEADPKKYEDDYNSELQEVRQLVIKNIINKMDGVERNLYNINSIQEKQNIQNIAIILSLDNIDNFDKARQYTSFVKNEIGMVVLDHAIMKYVGRLDLQNDLMDYKNNKEYLQHLC